MPTLEEEFAVTLKTTESFYSCPVGLDPNISLGVGGGSGSPGLGIGDVVVNIAFPTKYECVL